MPHTVCGWCAVRSWACTLLLLAAAVVCAAETRPRYGGGIRVEIRQAIDSADPPAIGRGIPDLPPGFLITRWEAGHRATFGANDAAPGGRPFADGVEVTMEIGR